MRIVKTGTDTLLNTAYMSLYGCRGSSYTTITNDSLDGTSSSVVVSLQVSYVSMMKQVDVVITPVVVWFPAPCIVFYRVALSPPCCTVVTCDVKLSILRVYRSSSYSKILGQTFHHYLKRIF